MKTPRIYVPEPLVTDLVVALPDNAAAHVTRVLRMQPGEALVVFNGQGGEHQAILERTERHRAWVRVGSLVEREAESGLEIALAQGVSKGDRMDYTIQKAVELGVSRIIPVLTERTVVQLKQDRLEKRQQHWQSVAVSACEQCGRNRVPRVEAPVAFRNWLLEVGPVPFGLLMDPRAETGLHGLKPTNTSIALLAGPEGGLSDEEVTAARRAGFQGVRLGPRILRTETAAVAMLAAVQTLWGDLG